MPVSADNPQTGTANDGDLPGLSGTGNEYSPQRSYTGREPDAVTGLLYYDARWYDPGVAQFISEDPIGFAAGDANLRRYVGNSMPNAVDPTGLEEKEMELVVFGRPNVGGPRVQYQGEIMFPQVARRLGIPGSDDSDTYSRWDSKEFEAGVWLVKPYYARDTNGKEYIRYYSAITR
ncbi:MAG: RHS repeat-associated core domain-containing protein [Planctomyces sp.]|nr:RHS repeat-associated core domain-containing protein [Planctomyces sp.]